MWRLKPITLGSRTVRHCAATGSIKNITKERLASHLTWSLLEKASVPSNVGAANGFTQVTFVLPKVISAGVHVDST